MLLRKSISLGAVAALSAFLSGSAPATALTLTPTQTADDSYEENDTELEFLFQKFDPTVYGSPLKSVHIKLTLTSSINDAFIYCASGPCTGSLTGVPSSLSAGDDSLGQITALTQFNYNLTSGIGGPFQGTESKDDVLELEFLLETDPSIIGLFEGSGNISLSLSTLSPLLSGTGTAAVFSYSMAGSGQAQLYYDYEEGVAIPEPLTILGTGTAALMGVMMKRRQRNNLPSDR